MADKIKIAVDGEDGTVLSRNPGIRLVTDNDDRAVARASLSFPGL